MTEIPIRDFERDQQVAVVSDEGGYLTIRAEPGEQGAEEVLREIFAAGDGGVQYVMTGVVEPTEEQLAELSEEVRADYEENPEAYLGTSYGTGRVEPGEEGFGGALSDALPSPYEVPADVRAELSHPSSELDEDADEQADAEGEDEEASKEE